MAKPRIGILGNLYGGCNSISEGMDKTEDKNDDDTTTVSVTHGNWKRLNAKKEPGESFDDAIGRILDEYESRPEQGAEPTEVETNA